MSVRCLTFRGELDQGPQLLAPAAAVEDDGDPSLADQVPHLAKQPGQGLRQRSVDLPGKSRATGRQSGH